jgi:general secretion pathway protein K
VDKDGNYSTRQKELLERFLSSEEFDLESEDVGNILDAIKDWIDPDSEVTKFGAENAYYQALEKPYACKNGPLAFPEELLLIRGITKELFYGTNESRGISSYITTYGEGRININTADPFVLRALSEHMDQELVDDLLSYRENEDNDLSQVGWYKSIPGMSSVSIDDLIATSSTYFEIVSDGFQNAMRKRVAGFVEKKDKKIKILSWSVE